MKRIFQASSNKRYRICRAEWTSKGYFILEEYKSIISGWWFTESTLCSDLDTKEQTYKYLNDYLVKEVNRLEKELNRTCSIQAEVNRCCTQIKLEKQRKRKGYK